MTTKKQKTHTKPIMKPETNLGQASPIGGAITQPSASTIPVNCAFDKLVDLTELVPNPRNPNKHGDRQVALLAKVIRHQGWRAPIVVSNRSGFIVSGHGRLEAAKVLQVEKVPVDYQDFTTEADEWAHLVADNRLAELAEIDDGELAALLKDLEGKIELDLTGFDKDGLADLEGFTVESEVDAEPQIDKAAELQEKWKTERGQVWQLGEHRLMCGDSTSKDDVGKLTGSEKADVCVTSPPYNLGSNHHTATKKTQAYCDDIPEDEYQRSQQKLLRLVSEVVTGDCFYQHKNRIKHGVWITPVDWIRVDPWMLAQEVVWINGGPNMDPCRFYPQTERIYWLTRDTTTTKFNNEQSFTDWWQISPVGTDGPHTRAYPVEIPSRIIRASHAQVVYEPYSGSGTTLIACERLGRKCRAMEISPAYVAVAIQRWADATGKEPKLL